MVWFLLQLLVLVFHFTMTTTAGCTTVLVSPKASHNGGGMCAHSNDGDGDVAGTMRHVAAASHAPNTTRSVSGGTIPQVPNTYQYKTEGYAIMNEFAVGLCESTCNGVFTSARGWGSQGLLNIVDLSQLALERAKTAREAVQVMGTLAETFGYRDAAESMLVVDPVESWIFHILPDNTNRSAIWVAEQVVGSQIATVANAFIIQHVEFPLDGSTLFLGSSNLQSIALQYGWWHSNTPFDFSSIYSNGELGPKYNSGRRMWAATAILAPNKTFSPTYTTFAQAYPTTVAVSPRSITPALMFTVMRSFYQHTPYDLTVGLAAGPFGNPFRAHVGKGALSFPNGRWERSIATWKTQVSYIATPFNGFIWFAPHAAHTAVYLPFHVTLPTTSAVQGPVSISQVNRSTAFWVNRYVFHLSQLHFELAYVDIEAKRHVLETHSFALVDKYASQVSTDPITVTRVMNANANAIVAAWKDVSEGLLVKYGEGNCNGCGTRHLGYPAWWLKDVGFNRPMPMGMPMVGVGRGTSTRVKHSKEEKRLVDTRAVDTKKTNTRTAASAAASRTTTTHPYSTFF